MRLGFACIPYLLTACITRAEQSDSSLDAFIARQVIASRRAILANIGGVNGTNVSGVPDGVVIKSPSRINPDYFFCWTRDSAITFQALVEGFIYGIEWLEPLIKSYADSVQAIQRVENPSGTIDTGGLGEPKFYSNGTAFMQPWRRPQRDGPALRASALIDFALSVYSTDEKYVTSTLWPCIKNDLDYVVKYWNMTGFDLWEEVDSSSFFTIAVQHKALRKGFELSSLFGIANGTYFDHSQMLLCFLQSFWTGDHIVANFNVNAERSGLDASTILASIYTFSPDLGCDEKTFQPCSARALANHKLVVDSFRTMYAINGAVSTAVAIGRYPEDNYYGGNPWYITTIAAAEQLYDALNIWQKLHQVNITADSLNFFQALLPNINVGSYDSDSPLFAPIMSSVRSYADDILKVIQAYIPSWGSIHEQFSKFDGMPISAADLTWSYVSILTMDLRRRQFNPLNWGNTLSLLPTEDSCDKGPTAPVDTVLGNFNLNASTSQAYLSGNLLELGKWSSQDPIKMTSSTRLSYWTVNVSLPGSTSFQYKYILEDRDGHLVWENGYDRGFTTPATGHFTVNDIFRT